MPKAYPLSIRSNSGSLSELGRWLVVMGQATALSAVGTRARKILGLP